MSQLTSVQRLALWTERLHRLQSADLTVAEFCRRELVSVPSFYSWKKQLNQSCTSKRPVKRSSQADPKFVPLVLNTDTAMTKLKLSISAVNWSLQDLWTRTFIPAWTR